MSFHCLAFSSLSITCYCFIRAVEHGYWLCLSFCIENLGSNKLGVGTTFSFWTENALCEIPEVTPFDGSPDKLVLF